MPSSQEKAYAHYGIDPEGYSDTFRYGDHSWCSVCANHYAANPLPRCDLEAARAEDIEAEGFDVRFCPHCRQAYPWLISKAGLCPACRKRDDLKSAEIQRQLDERRKNSPFRNTGAAVYIPDGVGCVEKVPRWMVDWDGNPNG